MRRKKITRKLIGTFILGISICFTISTSLLISAPIPSIPTTMIPKSTLYNSLSQDIEEFKSNNTVTEAENSTNLYKIPNEDENENKNDNHFTKIIRNLIHNSYLSYWTRCKHSDYLKPISSQCLNSSGLSITSIESLEILFLSNLKDDLKETVDYVLNKFNCRSSKFQNFHEMGTKVLGGLIGIFSLTKNRQFIEKAIECADVMKSAFKSSVPYPIIDGVKNRPKKYSFIKGNFLSESSGFLLEFSSLSKITGDRTYEDYVNNYLNCVLSLIKSSESLPRIVSVEKCEIIKSPPKFGHFYERENKTEQSYGKLNAYTASFIGNVIRLHLHSPSNLTAEIVDYLSDFLLKEEAKNNGSSFDSSFCQLGLLAEVPKLNNSPFYKNLIGACEAISMDSLPALKSDVSDRSNLKVKNDGFYFDFIPPFANKNHSKYLELLNMTKCVNAQCALRSQNPAVHDDLMPSEFFSKWMKFLYLSNSSSVHFSKKDWIINEAGHLIMRNFI